MTMCACRVHGANVSIMVPKVWYRKGILPWYLPVVPVVPIHSYAVCYLAPSRQRVCSGNADSVVRK